jgi:outer membrane PBP1 activator LpoA protein
MNLDEFFADVERLRKAKDNQRRAAALSMLAQSTLRDDPEGEDEILEEEIRNSEITSERWREIFERLKLNQLPNRENFNYTETEITKDYKHGIDN